MIRKILFQFLLVTLFSSCINNLLAQTDSSSNGTDSTHFALRVVFVQFETSGQPGGILISWSTILETNLAWYEVERSNDYGEFVSIGKIMAVGTTSVAVSYSFTDLSPLPGKNVYRLKMVDTRNGFNYTETITQNWAKTNFSTSYIRTYPNPVNRGSDLFIQSPELPGNAFIRIFTMGGKQVWQKEAAATHNYGYSITLPATLPCGIYVVQVNGLEVAYSQSQKIIVN